MPRIVVNAIKKQICIGCTPWKAKLLRLCSSSWAQKDLACLLDCRLQTLTLHTWKFFHLVNYFAVWLLAKLMKPANWTWHFQTLRNQAQGKIHASGEQSAAQSCADQHKLASNQHGEHLKIWVHCFRGHCTGNLQCKTRWIERIIIEYLSYCVHHQLLQFRVLVESHFSKVSVFNQW